MIPWRVKNFWVRFWINQGGYNLYGRFATRMAAYFHPPYISRVTLARYSPKGFISPLSTISHFQLRSGKNILIDDRVLIFQGYEGGEVVLGDKVCVFRDTIIQTGLTGSIEIGSNSSIQPRNILSAYISPIKIGKDVQIAANCNFYSYDHSVDVGTLIRKQPLTTKGGIVVEDDCWIGVNVTILDGVTIGKGAVIGAGSVVNKDIPESAIACGVPAQVVKMRTKFKKGS